MISTERDAALPLPDSAGVIGLAIMTASMSSPREQLAEIIVIGTCAISPACPIGIGFVDPLPCVFTPVRIDFIHCEDLDSRAGQRVHELTGKLYRNEYGIPSIRQTVLVSRPWVESAAGNAQGRRG